MDNSPLEPTNPPLGNARITRRTFIRRTAGATAITVLALQGFRYQSLAAENDAHASLGTVYTKAGVVGNHGPYATMAEAHAAIESLAGTWVPTPEPDTYYDSYKQEVKPIDPPVYHTSTGIQYSHNTAGQVVCTVAANATMTFRHSKLVP
jgi:hypothetical protein